jgi:hypothetical protein
MSRTVHVTFDAHDPWGGNPTSAWSDAARLAGYRAQRRL